MTLLSNTKSTRAVWDPLELGSMRRTFSRMGSSCPSFLPLLLPRGCAALCLWWGCEVMGCASTCRALHLSSLCLKQHPQQLRTANHQTTFRPFNLEQFSTFFTAQQGFCLSSCQPCTHPLPEVPPHLACTKHNSSHVVLVSFTPCPPQQGRWQE